MFSSFTRACRRKGRRGSEETKLLASLSSAGYNPAFREPPRWEKGNKKGIMKKVKVLVFDADPEKKSGEALSEILATNAGLLEIKVIPEDRIDDESDCVYYGHRVYNPS